MNNGAERNQVTLRYLEDNLQSFVQQNRTPFFLDMVHCIIPPEGAVSGEWSLGECKFFAKTGELLGPGELIILHPTRAAKLSRMIEDFKTSALK